MDRAAEAMIAERILAERPGDAILGEEGGESGHGRVRWIVDPLDGTVNYLYGLADWAVSIAAEVDGAVVAGVVAVPRHREVFTAVAGQGSWLHPDGAPAVAAAVQRRGAAGARPWSPPASATRGPGGRCRARSWPPCCPRSATSAGAVRRGRSVLGRGRPGRRLLRAGRQLLGLAAGGLASSRPRPGRRWPGCAASRGEPELAIAAGPGLFQRPARPAAQPRSGAGRRGSRAPLTDQRWLTNAG